LSPSSSSAADCDTGVAPHCLTAGANVGASAIISALTMRSIASDGGSLLDLPGVPGAT
jgi:hypothetical protein